MARYTGPRCRLCRAEGKKLFLKGERCKTDKCPINRKRPAPGKNPKARSGKVSDYAVQLREKQKLKRIYGLMEKQFHLAYEKALRMPGKTGDNLFGLLGTQIGLRRVSSSFRYVPLPGPPARAARPCDGKR